MKISRTWRRSLPTIILFLLCVCSQGVLAQAPGAPGSAQSDFPRDENKEEVKKVREASAWTLTGALGAHKKATIDTLLYNYQRNIIPTLQSDCYATTGNLGAEGINMIYSERLRPTDYFFGESLSAWTMSLDKQKLYNVYTPMTLLSYNFGGNKENHTDRLNGQFAGNVNRRIGVSAFIDYIYSKGCYEAQATKDFQWGLGAYYTGDRYEMQALWSQLYFLNKENGGITDDLYIKDPAEVQGGVDKIEPKSIPTRLNATHNRMTGAQFLMTHAFKVGFWTTEEVNDTLTRDVYVPVTRFVYSMRYEGRHRFFKNTNATQGQEFWPDHYFNPDQTSEHNRYWGLTNSLGIEMIEGFRKWAKFGLSAYASYQIRRYTQPTGAEMALPDFSEGQESGQLTPFPAGLNISPKITQHLLWIGGRIEKTKGSLLNYTADAKFGLVGDAVGEIDAHGDISTNFKLFGDTVSLGVSAAFTNLTPSFFLREYVSNHFVWKNNFGKVRTFRVDGMLHIPWTSTTLSAGVENTQNYVYFDSDSHPAQWGRNIQVFWARLDQKLRFGIWNWNNTLTYQATSTPEVMPLPAFTLYSNMFLGFKAFKVLNLQIGLDCNFYTKYRGLEYQPGLMAFRVQAPDKNVKVGDFAFANLYATAKLYKVRFYVMWAHFNQNLFSRNYFSLPSYPVNTRRLMLGLSIDFAD